ncbi:LysM peptidoglycan-binding domain-containing protein [Actinophytocola sp. KF-1]
MFFKFSTGKPRRHRRVGVVTAVDRVDPGQHERRRAGRATAAAFLGNAARYPEIMSLNGLTTTVLQPGMKLKIPGMAKPTAKATATGQVLKIPAR